MKWVAKPVLWLLVTFSRLGWHVEQRSLQEKKIVVVFPWHSGTIRTEKITRKEECGCPLRTAGSNSNRETYKKRRMWSSLPDIREQFGQRSLQKKKNVVVPTGHPGAIQTEKTARDDVCSRPFRTLCADRRTVRIFFRWSRTIPVPID